MPSLRRERAEPPREKTMDFEDLLEAAGSYGKYQQRLMYFFLIPISFTIPFLCMNQIFFMSAPEHWCHEPTVSSAEVLSPQEKIDLVRPPNRQPNALQAHDSCNMYNLSYTDVLNDLKENGWNTSWYVKENSANWTTVPCQNGWDYDKSLYSRTATTDWNLVCSNDYLPNLVFTVITIGSAIGTPVFGAVSDRVGRKISFFAASIIGVVSAVLTVTIPSFIGFTIVRGINGTLLPSVFQLPYLILVEIVAPDMRTRANGVACIGWTVGLALMPLVAWLTANWISFGWVCAVASFPYVFYYWVLPESPRWLISRERFDDANAVFQKMAKVNGKDISHLDMIPLLKKCSHQEKQASPDTKTSPMEFLKKPTLFRRFIFITVCWTADSMAYYGFHINVSALYGNEFLSFFLLALVEFPSYILTWYLMESKFGRRWTNVFFLFLTAFVCILPVMDPHDSKVLTTVASLVGKFGVSASFMVMYQQSAEIFPTTLRASGMGIAGTLANVISTATPFIIYLGIYGHHIPYTVMSVISLLAGVCALFIPETLNENLPQTVDDGESFGKDKEFFSFAKTTKPDPMSLDVQASTQPPTELKPMCTEKTTKDKV